MTRTMRIQSLYEWKEEYGDVGPRNEELEKMLFHDEYLNRAGNKFDRLREVKVTAETTHQPDPVKNFDEAGLHPVMRENIKLCGYKVPTPIQAYAIPAVLTGNDLIAVAQTGSGKTAAFLIPVLSKLMGKAKKLAAPRPDLGNGFNESLDCVRAEPLVLIVVPTRELSTQIFDEARRLCYRSMLRPCVVYGGGPTREQRLELQKGCDVLIGTPGRLLDFMEKPHILSLHRVKYTIVDEADEMLHSDWETELSKLMSGGDTNEDADHRYMMFSATFNKGCRELARKFLAADHVRIRIGRAGSAHLNVSQNIVYAEDHLKKQALYDLLISMPPSRTLVFVNTKTQADLIDDYLYNMGLPSTSIHSDRTQREREDALGLETPRVTNCRMCRRAFKTAKSPIMVATGVSARGLDIKNVMHVINFDMPSATHGGIEEYIHRIGRTARIGNEGLATSFYNHDRNSDIAADLVKILLECKQPLPDFLESEKPEGDDVRFNDDTDDEDEKTDGGDASGGDGWGPAPTATSAEPEAAPGWNTENPSIGW
ncbi:DEAD-box protein [Histoplasma capsulatum]|uniref:RNA helicase n=1 Tax=Ajellomyces capsulatus TaxID=5037 RepID=A0A8A1MHH2_AJECA|nr:DEAD-box protein [Histoplasma capsulatum]